ncbi:hypothetical protein ElyMa_004668400 [Elysia marginata]|uniref:Uncharacterized protein n=1 Tax=Elysia marginata TaxID=1093978 RepID=A0AAV4I335_9GAST|nr:hypothetical protein ElyMa_004668400 [Elysia marginata]
MLCVCVPQALCCRRNELASVRKDRGGAHRVKQSVLVSASKVMRYDKASETERKLERQPCAMCALSTVVLEVVVVMVVVVEVVVHVLVVAEVVEMSAVLWAKQT